MQIMKFTMHDHQTSYVGFGRGRPVDPPWPRRDSVDRNPALGRSRRDCESLASASAPVAISSVRVLAPIDDQEVWARASLTNGVRSRDRVRRAATFYDLVYRADRPELFFKATRSRVVDPGQAIRVRRDSVWCVPEPELALVLSPALELKGITIGNDVSARDIEGENPLYLPQAKVYDGCCAGTIHHASVGHAARGIDRYFEWRSSATAPLSMRAKPVPRMARRFDELIDWLGRDNVFQTGVFLLTGTGIVPADDFSLKQGDLVQISIDGIGVLTNPVVQRTTV